MKTALEIHRKLAALLSDQRMTYPTATIAINAPLALIQCSQGAQINALEWALDLPPSTFPLPARKLSKAAFAESLRINSRRSAPPKTH